MFNVIIYLSSHWVFNGNVTRVSVAEPIIQIKNKDLGVNINVFVGW